MKKTAKEIQTLLGVEDHEIIAYGYNFDRHSVWIYFENGELVKESETNQKEHFWQRSQNFESDFFHSIKRWYKGTPEKGFNQKLIDWFDTFGSGLPIVEGGMYP